jgi:hypothetical protein
VRLWCTMRAMRSTGLGRLLGRGATASGEPNAGTPPRSAGRALVGAGAWLLATGAAVTLSWWGVDSVMAGTAYDAPRAVPLVSGSDVPDDSTLPPLVPATERPESFPPSPHPTAGSSGGAARRTGGPSPSTTSRPKTAAGGPTPDGGRTQSSAPPAGTVRSYEVNGGHLALDIGATSASLVSATPDAGWQVQVWTQPTWIRVMFSRDSVSNSVFCTWNGHSPTVQLDTH